MMPSYQNKNVVIVGIGTTGISCINYFLSQGVTPKVMDKQEVPKGASQIPSQIECHFGSFQRDWLLAADLVVVSPGISLHTPIFQEVRAAGIEIVGDIELFCREAKAPIIAITGSNGKTTITTLISEMLQYAGIKVGTGGNIGFPALCLLKENYEQYVLELSSFQLETTENVHAAISVVLNISEDHMDRYPEGLEQYKNAKLRIYRNAEHCVVNADDSLTECAVGQKRTSFGMKSGEYHLIEKDSSVWLTHLGEAVLNTQELFITGTHNHINALVALTVADILKLPRAISLEVLKQFKGLKHRFQIVLEKEEVRWINDSKSTNVGSTQAALSGISLNGGTLHLLLGGEGKGADFTPLIPYLKQKSIAIYCFGQDAEKLMALHPEVSQKTETLEQAMNVIFKNVKPNDTVLLSPACASLDQFQNYEKRGDEFARLVKELTSC